MSDKIFTNGVIYTLNPKQPLASGIVVTNGRIIEVGEGCQLLAKYKGAKTEVIDFQGNMVLPGLTDSHMHLVAYGMKLQSLDFSECQSALAMKRKLQDKIAMTPEGEWVLGVGWNENSFADQKIFSKEELDELSTRHPIFLTRICNHAYIANSLALEMAGITKETTDPPGGKIVRTQDGSCTGYLLDNAGLLVQQLIPEPTHDEIKHTLQRAIQDCWSKGLVGAHSEDTRHCGGYGHTHQLFNEVLHEENFPFRVHQLPYHEYLGEISQLHSFFKKTSFFDFGAIKLFADGAIGGRTALLSDPYSDDLSTHGVAFYSAHELKEIVRTVREYQFPIAVHTIGDLALEYTLDAIESVPLSKGLDRIIHAQVVRRDLVDRMKHLSLIVDIQPRFVASDFPWIIDRLGEERIRWSYAWKTLLHAGIPCAGGSDAPIEPVDPLLGLHAAVTRIRPDESMHEGYLPEQRLSLLEAIGLFTKGSAQAEQKYDVKGSIEIGKYADFTVFQQDLFQTEPAAWLENKAMMTVVHGNVVYQA